MWLSGDWEDFEVVDCSGGEKLERWGEYYLVRPDPQVIWNSPRTHRRWKSPDASYKRSNSGGGQWEHTKVPDSWLVRYGQLSFNVKLMNFKHTGIFPEQAANWDWLSRIISKRRGVRVLNLFAYTGAATMACLAAGASVCHVDAARGMVSWAKENAALCGLSDKPVRWIVDDCRKFVEREIKRGKRYDAIIMDPPSYGRGPGGETWKLEDDLHGFLELCAKALSDRPLFVLINSYTTGLSPLSLTYLSETVFSRRFGGMSESAELGLKVSESGLVLPCGASCRWYKD